MPDDKSWLVDILDAARDALSCTEGMDRTAFLADRKTQLAVELLIIIIGEASGKVSPEARANLPAVPFTEIVRMRNRLVHHYFKVDLDLVWDVVTTDLQPLLQAIEAYLKDLGADPSPHDQA